IETVDVLLERRVMACLRAEPILHGLLNLPMHPGQPEAQLAAVIAIDRPASGQAVMLTCHGKRSSEPSCTEVRVPLASFTVTEFSDPVSRGPPPLRFTRTFAERGCAGRAGAPNERRPHGNRRRLSD